MNAGHRARPQMLVADAGPLVAAIIHRLEKWPAPRAGRVYRPKASSTQVTGIVMMSFETPFSDQR